MKVLFLSGGGFFVDHKGKWILRGLVSGSILKPDLTCDVERYALYTQVSKFFSWINGTITTNNGFQ